MSQRITETQTCHCCKGDMPADPVWGINRDYAGECDGSIDARTGRCRAWVEDTLWEIAEDADERSPAVHDDPDIPF